MNLLSYHENMQRGTPDFPVEYHYIEFSHPKYFMQMHWHKDFEIIRVLKGSFTLHLNSAIFTLNEDGCAVIPGGIIHGGEPEKCVYECLVFSPSVLYTSQKCRSLIKAHFQSPVIYEKSDIADGIFDAVRSHKHGYELRLTGMLFSLMGSIAASELKTDILPDEKLEKIKSVMSLIEENYNKKLTLGDLADACHMSPNYFSRYFKTLTNRTPFEYIINCRLEAACEMLLNTNDDITDICFSCGFNDLSYFIHIFKRHRGVSPNNYRKKRGNLI